LAALLTAANKSFQYFSFDTIGDLVFGESFGSLEHSRSNPWIDAIIGDLRSALLFTVINEWPGMKLLTPLLIPKSAIEHREYNFRTARDKALKRAAMREERQDFMVKMAQPGAVTEKELIMNTISLIGPGSETAATVLSGATYYLVKNPAVLKKLVEEVRSSFSSAEDITFLKVSQQEYMLAVLDEALRLYPVCLLGNFYSIWVADARVNIARPRKLAEKNECRRSGVRQTRSTKCK